MGFWDVLLFNIATVLGPRWVAAAAHNGTILDQLVGARGGAFSSFLRGLVINELSSRFPEEGGFTSGPRKRSAIFTGSSLVGTIGSTRSFIFRGYCSPARRWRLHHRRQRGGDLAQNRTFLLVVSFALLIVAVVLNIIGLNIGKWLQNAGGIATYLPLLMLVAIAALI